MEILRADGEAVRAEPGKEVLGAWLVDGASEDAPVVVGVVAEEIALAMNMQHDRRDRCRVHRRCWRRDHTAGGGGMAGRAEEWPLDVGAELAETHGRSGASGLHDLSRGGESSF